MPMQTTIGCLQRHAHDRAKHEGMHLVKVHTCSNAMQQVKRRSDMHSSDVCMGPAPSAGVAGGASCTICVRIEESAACNDGNATWPCCVATCKALRPCWTTTGLAHFCDFKRCTNCKERQDAGLPAGLWLRVAAPQQAAGDHGWPCLASPPGAWLHRAAAAVAAPAGDRP